MSSNSVDSSRRSFLKGSLVTSGILCALTENLQGATLAVISPTMASESSGPKAGPVKVNWIKVFKDGMAPNRVFFEGQSGMTKSYYYFDLTPDNAGQVGTLAASMAAADGDPLANVYYDSDSGVNMKYVYGDKTGPATGPDPRYPTTGTMNSHANIKSIRTTP